MIPYVKSVEVFAIEAEKTRQFSQINNHDSILLLHIAARFGLNNLLIQLMKRNINVNALNKYSVYCTETSDVFPYAVSSTAIGLASYFNHQSTILLLLEYGADPNMIQEHKFCGSCKQNAILAAIRGHCRALYLLVINGVYVPDYVQYMLSTDQRQHIASFIDMPRNNALDLYFKDLNKAVTTANEIILYELLCMCNINYLLQSVIQSDSLHALTYYVQKGIDVNCVLNDQKETPLMLAVRHNRIAMIEILIKYGARGGNDLLNLAIQNQNIPMVNRLLGSCNDETFVEMVRHFSLPMLHEYIAYTVFRPASTITKMIEAACASKKLDILRYLLPQIEAKDISIQAVTAAVNNTDSNFICSMLIAKIDPTIVFEAAIKERKFAYADLAVQYGGILTDKILTICAFDQSTFTYVQKYNPQKRYANSNVLFQVSLYPHMEMIVQQLIDMHCPEEQLSEHYRALNIRNKIVTLLMGTTRKNHNIPINRAFESHFGEICVFKLVKLYL